MRKKDIEQVNKTLDVLTIEIKDIIRILNESQNKIDEKTQKLLDNIMKIKNNMDWWNKRTTIKELRELLKYINDIDYLFFYSFHLKFNAVKNAVKFSIGNAIQNLKE